jgi:hypothetical protein
VPTVTQNFITDTQFQKVSETLLKPPNQRYKKYLRKNTKREGNKNNSMKKKRFYPKKVTIVKNY